MTVYLVNAKGTQLYKIGQSDDYEERLRQLRNTSPIPLVLISYLGWPSESWWHWTFSWKRSHGEWFYLDDEDVCFFEEVERINVLGQQTTRPVGEILRAFGKAIVEYSKDM